jgi:hypothetical protein
MPTILKPPGDQWASTEVTDSSHLCSDPTSASVCQMSANMSRRPWPSLLLEGLCPQRFGRDRGRWGAGPRPRCGLFEDTRSGLAFLDG